MHGAKIKTYKLFLLTLYGVLAAAMRCYLNNNIHFYY